MKQINLEATKLMLWGNVLFVICCVFYLIWWLVAFKPEHAIKGWKSGWLLVPATIAGLTGLYLLVKGMINTQGLIVTIAYPIIIIVGVVTYFVLLCISYYIFHRIITTELFLIVGWTMLEVCLINTISALSGWATKEFVIMLVVTVVVFIASMVCYMLFYKVNKVAGYIVGIIPLVLVGVMSLINSLYLIKCR